MYIFESFDTMRVATRRLKKNSLQADLASMQAFVHLNETGRLAARLPDEILQSIHDIVDGTRITMRCGLCANPVLLLRTSWWVGSNTSIEYSIQADGQLLNLKSGARRRPCAASDRLCGEARSLSLRREQGTLSTRELPSLMRHGTTWYHNAVETYGMVRPYFIFGSECVCYACRFERTRTKKAFSLWRSTTP